MKIGHEMTDEVVLEELGRRLAALRLARNLKQAELAVEAGVSKRTIERLEAGAVAAQLTGFIRVCRVLGLMERFDLLVPEALPGPMEQLQRGPKPRRRASAGLAREGKAPGGWTWGAGA